MTHTPPVDFLVDHSPVISSHLPGAARKRQAQLFGLSRGIQEELGTWKTFSSLSVFALPRNGFTGSFSASLAPTGVGWEGREEGLFALWLWRWRSDGLQQISPRDSSADFVGFLGFDLSELALADRWVRGRLGIEACCLWWMKVEFPDLTFSGSNAPSQHKATRKTKFLLPQFVSLPVLLMSGNLIYFKKDFVLLNFFSLYKTWTPLSQDMNN